VGKEDCVSAEGNYQKCICCRGLLPELFLAYWVYLFKPFLSIVSCKIQHYGRSMCWRFIRCCCFFICDPVGKEGENHGVNHGSKT
jgi:hypothetical protein